jgi:uncharacterized protein (DUF1330 family)
MPAHGIVQIEEVLDPAGLQQYVEQVVPLMAQFGGRYIITSFQTEPLEGGWHPQGIAVVEFETADQLRAFWNSPEYEPLRQLRQRSVRTRIIMADTPVTEPSGARA